MRTSSFLKLVCLVTAFVSSASKGSAQYFVPDYSLGGIMWCAQMDQRINAMQMQNAMMRQQVLNYYRQQAAAATQHMMNNPCSPISGVMTYDGVYVTPETVNEYHKENVTCEHCDGGYNYRNVYMGGGETRQVKSRCSWCHGKGYVTKTVRNE